jgi:hypothetical protein
MPPTFAAPLASRPLRSAIAAACLLAGLALAAPAALGADAPRSLGMQGRWTLDLARSDYDEATLGPKPASAAVEVERDDGKALGLSWSVVDADGRRHTESFEAPLTGRSAAGLMDGRPMRVSIMRMSERSILITTSLDNGRWDYIVAYLTDAGALTFEEASFAPDGHQRQMTFVFRRAAP